MDIARLSAAIQERIPGADVRTDQCHMLRVYSGDLAAFLEEVQGEYKITILDPGLLPVKDPTLSWPGAEDQLVEFAKMAETAVERLVSLILDREERVRLARHRESSNG